jgi:hypothetical protein
VGFTATLLTKWVLIYDVDDDDNDADADNNNNKDEDNHKWDFNIYAVVRRINPIHLSFRPDVSCF